jgi:glucose/arabinose dehydrogenase
VHRSLAVWRTGIVALALAAVAAACDDPAVAPDPRVAEATELARGPSAAVTCDADNGGLTLPPGFCAVVVAKGLGLARHVVVRPNGDIYVARNNPPTGGNVRGVMALRDRDGDGRADVREPFGVTGGNGIAWKSGFLYHAPNDRVIRWNLPDSVLVPRSAAVDIVSGLPAGGDHISKTIVLDSSGTTMYLNIGSASNSCQVQDRERESPGKDPCPELPVRAGVWTFDPNTPGQSQSDGDRFASELRNMVALAINPADQQLYGMQNGRDQLWPNWPQLFTPTDDALLPAEELFHIERDKLYGWPYCYYDPLQQKKVLAPEYGGDGNAVGRCSTRENPIDDYPAHWAPLGMLFYSGSQFPARYQGGLFIAFHGSRFDPSAQPAGPGYQVTFTPFASGMPTGAFETFADGFAGGNPTPTGAAHRPVGLAQGPDGSLYVSDDKGGWLWRIVYVGTGGGARR